MRQRLVEKGAKSEERIDVIPNWVDTTGLIQPEPAGQSLVAASMSCRWFVVMHSGNIGYAQNLDALIRAGTFRERDLDRPCDRPRRLRRTAG